MKLIYFNLTTFLLSEFLELLNIGDFILRSGELAIALSKSNSLASGDL